MERHPTVVERRLAQWASDLIDVRVAHPLITLRDEAAAATANLLDLAPPSPAELFAALADPRAEPVRLAASASAGARGAAVARASGQPVPRALRIMRDKQQTEQFDHEIDVMAVNPLLGRTEPPRPRAPVRLRAALLRAELMELSRLAAVLNECDAALRRQFGRAFRGHSATKTNATPTPKPNTSLVPNLQSPISRLSHWQGAGHDDHATHPR